MKDYKKFIWFNRLIFLLIGLWISCFVVAYAGKDILFFLGIAGAGVCFLSFIQYYSKTHERIARINNKLEAKQESHGFVEKKSKVWDK